MKRINLGALLIIFAVVLVFTGVGYLAGAASASPSIDATGAMRALLGRSQPTTASELVEKAFTQLEDQYFMDLDDATRQKMIYGAVQGMLQPLRDDPYADDFTNFYDPEFYKNLMAETEGRYAGIGILMGVTADGLYPEVSIVFPNTPAEEAGLKTGDVIAEVAGEDTFGMILPEVATKIKGEPGTKVKLKIYHADTSEITDHEIERREVEFSSITKTEMLDNGVGYIKLTNFAAETGADFRKSMEQLTGQGMNSLVLDLRDNPGGLLEAARDVADAFVEEGSIVKVEFRGNTEANEDLRADPNVKKYKLPILILVNGNSASASEVLTSALRDYGLAKVMGEQTFGKGVVQAVLPMEWESAPEASTQADGMLGRLPQPKSALAVVIGKYYTPEHGEIHKKGIEPDYWYDFQNLLKDDPQLKQFETQLEAQREEMNALRAKATQYLRDNDRTLAEAEKVARQLSQGRTPSAMPRIEPPEDEHSPLDLSNRSAAPLEGDVTGDPEATQPEGGE